MTAMQARIPTDRLADLPEGERGLTGAEAAVRRAKYGANDIVEAAPAAFWTLARATLRDPMLWFLLGTAALFTWLGDRLEALILLLALIPLIGMDAFLHRRTQASTQGLASRLASVAHTLRDTQWSELPARDLVPGDLVEVRAGEPVPADGLLCSGEHVQVDESMLSGESLPVSKQPYERDGHDAAPENWLAAGTRVLTGVARLRIVHTGGGTLYGEIARLAVQGTHARTPLQQAIGRLVGVLLTVAIAMCLLLAAIRLYQGHGLVDALLSGVTLAVAALPEEFPVVFTFFLGAGVYRLARRQALVRRAVVVENIGRVTCICSDKTGTMTAGRLVLVEREAAPGVEDWELLRSAALASRDDSGDPLDAAVLQAVGTAGTPAAQRVQVFPFTEARRRETAVWRMPAGSVMVVTKGAPETVLDLCAVDAAERARWLARVASHAASGHKVIAVATRRMGERESMEAEPDAGFHLGGLLAFADPLRAGVRDAVRACAQAGIRVIMVTGDHPGTARAIALQAGLGNGNPVVVTMEALASLDETVSNCDVVARAVPAQKLELVQWLQQRGEIVAVTGDGVNDAPALQAADIGIAMGESGAHSSREVAAIVLLDDNFRTVTRAIAEGRQLFRNLQTSFAYLLMVHVPLVLTAALVPLAGHPLLYLPIHIVWLELLIHPTAMLAFQDPPPAGHMALAPRARQASFFGRREWTVIALAGLGITAAVLIAYDRGHVAEGAVLARTLALATLILACTVVTLVLSGLRSHAARFIAAASVVSLVLLVQVPSLSSWVHLAPLTARDWLFVCLAAVVSAAPSLLLTHRTKSSARVATEATAHDKAAR